MTTAPKPTWRVWNDTKAYSMSAFRDFHNERTAREYHSRKGWMIDKIA